MEFFLIYEMYEKIIQDSRLLNNLRVVYLFFFFVLYLFCGFLNFK